MQEETIAKLNTINLNFYNKIGHYFDNSRQYNWDGWSEILNLEVWKSENLNVLDIGCGNGRFAGFVGEHYLENFKYTGIDSNNYLLEKAKSTYLQHCFATHDIIQDTSLPDPISVENYDLIVLFGVIHHIPSVRKRLDVIKLLKNKLSKQGRLIISAWNFLEDQKLSKKFIDWQEAGLRPEDVEEHDYLLPWERGAKAFRYCHWVSPNEQTLLISESGMKLETEFFADGKSGKLNRYIVLKS